MLSIRRIIFLLVMLSALILGALFASPAGRKEFVRMELGPAMVLAEVAEDPHAQSAGLSGRRNLPANAGMLFLFDRADRHGIWMKQMKFAIDIFWIHNGIVADIEENVRPPRTGTADNQLEIYRPDVPAEFVLETNAGFAKRHGIKIGDKAKIFSEKGGDILGERDAPGSKYFIENLQRTAFDGKNFKVEKILADERAYQKYQISYMSGDLKITGIMNVPGGAVPKGGYPVLILNHGLIPGEIYFSGRGSKREQDFFARHGYITIHPDYRGLASSSPNTITHHDFYQGYTEDVINAVEALKKARFPYIDTGRIGMWGHSMGGGIAARVMVLRPDILAFVLFAPISADSEDNFFELAKEEVEYLRAMYTQETLKKISPINYFDNVSSPVQIHHGTADKDVPIAFSQKIYDALKTLGKKVEFFRYPEQGHEFIEDWPLASGRALQFFDRYVKSR